MFIHLFIFIILLLIFWIRCSSLSHWWCIGRKSCISILSFLGAFVVLWISMILIFQFSFLNVVRRALVIGDYLVGLFSPYFLWVIRKIFAIFYQGWEWG